MSRLALGFLCLALSGAGGAWAQDEAPDDFVDAPLHDPADPADPPAPIDESGPVADEPPAPDVDDPAPADDPRAQDLPDPDPDGRDTYDDDYDLGYDDADEAMGLGQMLPWMGIGCAATAGAGCLLAWVPYVAFIGAGVLSVSATAISAMVGALMGRENRPEGAVSEGYEDGYRDGAKNAWLYNLFGSLIGSAVSHVVLAGLAAVASIGGVVVLPAAYLAFYGVLFAILATGGFGAAPSPGVGGLPLGGLGRLGVMPGMAGPRE